MLILTVRTDKPEAEIGLYENNQQLVSEKWQAHRQLAETIHTQVAKVLQSQKKDWNYIEGILVYKGPGSFTGLRIGLSVANALAAALGAPIVGSGEKNWLANGITRILNGTDQKIVLPDYGSPVFITKPKK